MPSYFYNLDAFVNDDVNPSTLRIEINNSSIASYPSYITTDYKLLQCEIAFSFSLTAPQIAILDTIVASHTGEEPEIPLSPEIQGSNIELPSNGQILVGGQPLSKNDIGLSNVDNTSDVDKPVSAATQSALNNKASTADLALKADSSSLTSHTSNLSNPHGTTAAQVGAEPANINIQAHISTTGNPHGTTATQVGAEPANVNIQSHISSTSNPHSVTKSQVGLSNVDNTSDVDKPISTAVQTALNLKLNTSLKGAINGLAELDSSGKIPTAQLPAYVDDVLEFANLASFPVTGESGKIYIALDTNITYRWSGTVYVSMTSSLALGETYSTAYRGDRGKIAYDHSQITTGNPHGTTVAQIGAEPANANIQNHISSVSNPHSVTKSQVGLGNVDNTSDINKPISTATQTALNAKENTITSGTSAQYWRGDKTFQILDKTSVGLSNVDNTSDVDKPISTAVQTALNAKENSFTKNTAFNKNFTSAPSDIKMNGTVSVGVSNDVPRADHIHPIDTSREPVINSGTTLQYWRGDKTWQTLPVFGSEFLDSYVADTSSTTSTTVNQIKNSITTPVIPSGVYRIDFHMLWRSGTANRNIRHCIVIDSVEYNVSGPNTSSNNASVIFPIAGFIYITLTNGTHIIQQAFRVGALGAATVYSKESRLSIFRVS